MGWVVPKCHLGALAPNPAAFLFLTLFIFLLESIPGWYLMQFFVGRLIAPLLFLAPLLLLPPPGPAHSVWGLLIMEFCLIDSPPSSTALTLHSFCRWLTVFHSTCHYASIHFLKNLKNLESDEGLSLALYALMNWIPILFPIILIGPQTNKQKEDILLPRLPSGTGSHSTVNSQSKL